MDLVQTTILGGLKMDRLTFEGLFCDIAQCSATPGGSFCEDGMCSQRATWERLKAYEDTGLTPEQCRELAAASKKERHGYWFDIGGLSCRCSMCGCKNDRVRPYCPVCGAKMDGGQDAEDHD